MAAHAQTLETHEMKRNRRSAIDMPVEIWGQIISKLNLDRHCNLHLQSLSRVCKHFLSITNTHKQTLKIYDPTAHFLPSLLRRFPNLKHFSFIDLSGDPLPILHQIADFNFRLESLDLPIPIDALKSLPVSTLTSVKSLKIWSSIADDDLKMIAEFFPNLEELDLRPPPRTLEYCHSGYRSDGDDNGCFNHRSFTWEYSPSSPGREIPEHEIIPYPGLSVLASKLKGLRRVKLKGFDWVTDEGVISLSDKCPDLEEIVVEHCKSVTKAGIRYALRKCRNLKTFGISGMDDIWTRLSTRLNLSAIHLSNTYVSDDSLLAMVNADLPLKSFSLICCWGVTYDGISSFFRRYNSLDHLALERDHFLSDESMITLAKSLKEVKSLKLNQSRNLSDPTLFTLIERCPMLESVEMMHNNLGKNGFQVDSALKCKIKTLNLAFNGYLSDSSLRKIALACPELEELRLRKCHKISTVGVWETLRNCPRLRHLAIDGCVNVDSLNLPDKDTLELEFLGASKTALMDNALVDISIKCPNLMSLNVMGCVGITSEGVVEVVDKCTKLKEIYLHECQNMTEHILAWMVLSRPSLRKVVPPEDHVLSAHEENLFMRHGCYLSSHYY